MYDRHPTSQVVAYNEFLFLIDCGEGTQLQCRDTKYAQQDQAYFYLSPAWRSLFWAPGLLTSYGLNNRTEPLIYCPHLLKRLLTCN